MFSGEYCFEAVTEAHIFLCPWLESHSNGAGFAVVVPRLRQRGDVEKAQVVQVREQPLSVALGKLDIWLVRGDVEL